MGKIGAGFSMSLDGFIAGPGDSTEHVFAWMFGGTTEKTVSTGEHEIPLKLAPQSAALFEEMATSTGAIVSGRRLFDVAGAWGGKHPLDVPIFVVTHHVPQEWVDRESPFTFVTDGVESAVAQAREVAGDKNVGVGGADITRQCLKAGLLDEIQIDLVPVLLGEGVRLFEYLGIEPLQLEITRVIEAPGVTHLKYRVLNPAS
jgi:dihydrofolate reductase